AFWDIQKESIKKNKEKLFFKNSNNEEFVVMMHLLLDDMITTGIAIKKFERDTSVSEGTLFSNIKDLTKYVLDNNTGSGEVVESIKISIAMLPPEYQEFMKQLFTKTFKCG